ncbi:MAG: hypothetical protein ACKVHQ_07100 [Gammaproteobacteria bacterium]|jgi:hypothetical protein
MPVSNRQLFLRHARANTKNGGSAGNAGAIFSEYWYPVKATILAGDTYFQNA